METQYYTLIEKQDFFEIIENKFGELAIFIDARDGSPVNPVLEFDGKKTALLKKRRTAGRASGQHRRGNQRPAGRSRICADCRTQRQKVERTYGVPVENVEEIEFKGRQTRADEIVKAKSKEDVMKSFGAIRSWSCGGKQ